MCVRCFGFHDVVQVDIALCDLILKLLCWEPVKRLSAMDALLHPFFDDLSPLRHLLQVVNFLSCASRRYQHLSGVLYHFAVQNMSMSSFMHSVAV